MTGSPRALAIQTAQLRQQQERLLGELLTVMDGLDRAADHWRQARANAAAQPPSASHEPPTGLARWWQALSRRLGLAPSRPSPSRPAASDDSLPAVIASADDGIAMIRESLLEVLSRQQVVPIEAMGQPFDPGEMLALGRRSEPAEAPDIVVEEVVRGYRWRDRLLREAQVIVASTAEPPPAAAPSSPPS